MSSHDQKFATKQYIDDANRVLGQSNGKTYQRIPGKDQEHDGQVMVRLRKKRFVVLDYSFAPTDEDRKAAKELPHVRMPDNAGKAVCIHVGCGKIGVPVCVYDSDPNEQEPLYMRSGFCFNCQRNLNHERRSERKRPAQKMNNSQYVSSPDIIYCVGPKPKHFKVGSRPIQLKEDALIISGTVPQMTPHGHHNNTHDLGHELISATEEAYGDASRLVGSLSGRTGLGPASLGGNGLDYHSLLIPQAPGDVSALYHKAFQSLSRSLVLLSQFKSSWDSTIAAANYTMADQSMVDAVASTVADGVPGSPVPAAHDGNNMVSLLLDAAGQNKDVEFTNNLMHSDDVHSHHSVHHDPTEYAV